MTEEQRKQVMVLKMKSDVANFIMRLIEQKYAQAQQQQQQQVKQQ